MHPYRPADPPWWPGDESGYEQYHRELFTLTARSSGFTRWKVFSTGINIARQLAGARNAAREAWSVAVGTDEASWPLKHPPALLWIPEHAYPACLGCWWLGSDSADSGGAAVSARRHAISETQSALDPRAAGLLLEPLRLWSHPSDLRTHRSEATGY
jgi:hypothetical protein